MPARPLVPKLKLSPEERIIYQRERNRRKQQNLRDRRKAAALAAKAKEGEGGGSSNGEATTRVEGGEEPAVKSASTSRRDRSDRESGSMWSEERQPESESSGTSRFEEVAVGCDESSLSLAVASTAQPNNSRRSPDSIVAAKSSRLSPASLFSALLNGFFPPLPPRPVLPSTNALLSSSFLSTIDPRLLKLALDVSAKPLPSLLRQLPSYSYESPVDSSSCSQPPNWKWSLFQLHKACHANRSHPTEGYLHNKASEAIVAEAQLLILQLLGSTSPNKEFFDSRRVLTQEQRDYLAYAPLDPRLNWWPDPLARCMIQKASSAGFVNFTLMMATSIETSLFCGDVWDIGALSMPDAIYNDLPVDIRGNSGHRSEVGKNLRGATIREIVLGLEQPGWRKTTTIFPPWDVSKWETISQAGLLHSFQETISRNADLIV